MTGRDYELERIAHTAMCVVTDVREVDPNDTYNTLTALCESEPGRMAQVLMALAIWVNPDETVQTLNRRAMDVGRAVA